MLAELEAALQRRVTSVHYNAAKTEQKSRGEEAGMGGARQPNSAASVQRPGGSDSVQT